jgi:hypothetical protein
MPPQRLWETDEPTLLPWGIDCGVEPWRGQDENRGGRIKMSLLRRKSRMADGRGFC